MLMLVLPGSHGGWMLMLVSVSVFVWAGTYWTQDGRPFAGSNWSADIAADYQTIQVHHLHLHAKPL